MAARAAEDWFGCSPPDEIEGRIRELNSELEALLRQYNERHPSVVRRRALLRELEQDALERCVEEAQNAHFSVVISFETARPAMEHRNWQCPKCDNQQFEVDQFRATGGMFAKIFDVQNKRFTTVTCSRCTYTEVYRSESSALGNVFDFFTQ